MNKKTAGRISAMAMASMMMMSVCVVNAAAEENEPITATRASSSERVAPC
jgi:hypothetical protein